MSNFNVILTPRPFSHCRLIDSYIQSSVPNDLNICHTSQSSDISFSKIFPLLRNQINIGDIYDNYLAAVEEKSI